MKGATRSSGSCPECGHRGVSSGGTCAACGFLLGGAPDPMEATIRLRAPGAPAVGAAPVPQADALPSGVGIALEVIAGPGKGTTFPILRRVVVIGREQGEIRINDPAISRRHASLEVLDVPAVSAVAFALTIILRDLSSTNGTYHNGQLIAFSRLHDGDEIRLGQTVLALTMDQV